MGLFVGKGSTLTANGTKIANITNVDISQSRNLSDATHSESDCVTNLAGHSDPGETTGSGWLDLGDAGLAVAAALLESGANAALVLSASDEEESVLTVSHSILTSLSYTGFGAGDTVSFDFTFKNNAHPVQS